MLLVPLLCFAALYLLPGINGKRIRSPCLQSSTFRCDNGDCIEKYAWCDGSSHCSDGSDEVHCDWPPFNGFSGCNDDIHFQCETGYRCIPREGYCDGYSSCPDQSDETDCPCEELLEEEGRLQYEAFIHSYQTQQKCWKITVKEGQVLKLEISADLFERNCLQGNITLFSDVENNSTLICHSTTYTFDGRSNIKRNFIFYESISIRYSSNFYQSSSNILKDTVNIKYKKSDVLCEKREAFRCSKRSCIASEKKCDGIRDCQNGLDEEKCEDDTFSALNFETVRKRTVQLMRNQHDADWGWKENTHKAVVALHLAGGLFEQMSSNSSGNNNDDELIAKQLELEVSTFLLGYKSDKKPISELSSYINALLVICHDPRHFYGLDLIETLKEGIESATQYAHPFLYLTLCNAKEPISEETVDRLLEVLQKSPNHGFVLEIQSLAVMALTCAINNNNKYLYLKQNISEALNSLKKEQMEDGSFGNEYTTAFVLQALIANNEERKKDWNITAAVKFLKGKQEIWGSHKDILLTYLILPLLNGKSLLDVGRVNCTESLKRPRDGGVVSDIKSRLGEKIVVKYSLFIGDEKDQIHPIVLRISENINILELMTLAADIDPKYKFKTHQVRDVTYVYEISNIPNNPESNTFWFLYEGEGNGTAPISEQSPDKVKVGNKEHIIMWYKSLNFM